MTNQLFLCFYGDQPYWDNLVLTSAYPTGFSYFRPFRYRDVWLDEATKNNFTSQNGSSSLTNAEATLCVRFSTREEWRLLPLRKVTITHTTFSAGTYQFYLRLGRFFDFDGVKQLSDACVEIPGFAPSPRTVCL